MDSTTVIPRIPLEIQHVNCLIDVKSPKLIALPFDEL